MIPAPASHNLDLCVSMVGGNEPEAALSSLRSLFESFTGELSVQVYFIENCSPKFDFAQFEHLDPRLTVIKNERRYGFGKNHNQVLNSVRAKYYLVLNDDTIVNKGLCEALIGACEQHPDAGFAGPMLLEPDGALQRSVYRFPNPLTNLLETLGLARCPTVSLKEPSYVEFVSGAALLIRREVLEAIQSFDERFFMYAEETDLILRGRRAGFRCLFVPGASVMHVGGLSSRGSSKARSVEFLRSQSKFIKKHYGLSGLCFYNLANIFKHSSRLVLADLRGKDRSEKQAHVDGLLWSLGLLGSFGLAEMAAEHSVKPN